LIDGSSINLNLLEVFTASV